MTRAEELRQAFDRAFAEPVAAPLEIENLLVIVVGGSSYAIRLDDIVALVTDRVVTAVPSPPPALLGIAGFRGSAVPVYDLRVLLEHSSAATPRCALITRNGLVALAFEALDGHVRAPRVDIAGAGDERSTRHVRAVVRARGTTLPILDVAGLVDGIVAQSRRANARENGGR